MQDAILLCRTLWFQHMFHHVWSLLVCFVQMVFQLSLGSVGNFWCGMQRVRILLHLLTPQLLHTKLEQLLNRQKIGRCTSINTYPCYFFTPVAIETSGVFGPKTTEFLKELGHRLRQVSGEANSFAYLTQRLSVAVQRGNAASVLGTIKMDSEEEEFLVPKLLYCMSEWVSALR